MAEADKRGTVKNIHATNQGNKVVGQIQSMQIKLPGYLKSLVAAINPNNPNDTKFFEETDQDGNKGEAKAIEYLNSKIGNQTVDVETVEDINEMPNFSVEEKESDISIPDLIKVQNNKTTKAFSQAKDKTNKKQLVTRNKLLVVVIIFQTNSHNKLTKWKKDLKVKVLMVVVQEELPTPTSRRTTTK